MYYYYMTLFLLYAILVDFVRKCTLAAAERIFYGQWIWGYNPKDTYNTDPDQRGEDETLLVDVQHKTIDIPDHVTEQEKHEKIPIDNQQRTTEPTPELSSDPSAAYSNISGAFHFGWRFAATTSILFMTRRFEDLLETRSSRKIRGMTEAEKEWRLVTAASLAFAATLAADVWLIGTCLVVKTIQKINEVSR